jgi:hypothetical protein
MRLVGRSEMNVMIGNILSGALVGVIFRLEACIWRKGGGDDVSESLLHDIYRVTQLGLA